MLLILLVLQLISGGASQAAPLSLKHIRNTLTTSPRNPPPCACPDTRSLSDIIWSCFATIFACAWVAVHPNMPAQDENWWQITLRRIEYMAWTILAPELMIYWAMRQYFGARSIAKDYRDREWSMVHGHFLQMGGFSLFNGATPSGVLLEGHFRKLLDAGKIAFPAITKEEIEDRSKSDSFAKCVVVGQTGWFVLQCIARRAEGLVLTELELVTVALATLNAFMYFFWWDKPFDVRKAVPVYLVEEARQDDPEPTKFDMHPTEAEMTLSRTLVNHDQGMTAGALAWPKLAILGIFLRMAEIAQSSSFVDESMDEGRMRVPTFYSSFTDIGELKLLLSASFIGTIFGAIHCTGWHFTFPTRFELIVWRVGSLSIFTLPPFYSMACIVYFRVDRVSMKESRLTSIKDAMKITAGICAPVYILARLTLIIGALLALRELQEGADAVVEWISYLPHI